MIWTFVLILHLFLVAKENNLIIIIIVEASVMCESEQSVSTLSAKGIGGLSLVFCLCLHNKILYMKGTWILKGVSFYQHC